jgi:hypothetical protein
MDAACAKANESDAGSMTNWIDRRSCRILVDGARLRGTAGVTGHSDSPLL